MPVEIPTDTAIKATMIGKKVEDVTDNDAEAPIYRIVEKQGYPKDQFQLDALKLISDYARKEKRLAVIKFIFGGLISSIPAVLVYLMGVYG